MRSIGIINDEKYIERGASPAFFSHLEKENKKYAK